MRGEYETRTLLAASLACGGDSARLGLWLLGAGAACRDRLLHAQALEAAGEGPALKPRLASALADPATARPPDGWQLISILDADYPALLRTLPDAPGLLYVRGDATLLHEPQIAIVGARAASPEGRQNARGFARALARAGFVVVSGLALGIDGAAHEGALESGRTLAVLGHGPGPVYPPRHRPMGERILAGGGALVTEFPPGLGPFKSHFPARNRIIAGLCLATVVVEAALRSGSLITARLAAEHSREVFAVPGSIHNPLSRGCHQLLRDGANWLEGVDDMLKAFGALHQVAQGSEPGEHTGLLAHFTGGVLSLDQLVLRSGLPVPALHRQLLDLELAGKVQRVNGGYCRLA